MFPVFKFTLIISEIKHLFVYLLVFFIESLCVHISYFSSFHPSSEKEIPFLVKSVLGDSFIFLLDSPFSILRCSIFTGFCLLAFKYNHITKNLGIKECILLQHLPCTLHSALCIPKIAHEWSISATLGSFSQRD